MTRNLLVELSDLFRREAEHHDAHAALLERRYPRVSAIAGERVQAEADRLHAIADELWERAEFR